MPVYLTLMIKKLVASRSEADEDGIRQLVRSYKDRCCTTLHHYRAARGKQQHPTLRRVNEGETSVEGCFDERKVASTSQSIHGGTWRATSTTFAAIYP